MLNIFTSTHEGSIDAKGRVSIPAPFRATLGGAERIYVWPATDGSLCLEGGGDALLNAYKQMLMRLSPQDPRRRAYMHAIFTRAADLKMDDGGRVKLPPAMLEKLGVKDKVLFAGALDRFQIWEPETFAAYDAKMAEAMRNNPDPLTDAFELTLQAGAIPGLEGGAE